jgi:hypothetical protein
VCVCVCSLDKDKSQGVKKGITAIAMVVAKRAESPCACFISFACLLAFIVALLMPAYEKMHVCLD